MKKKVILLLAMVMVFSLFATGCSRGGGDTSGGGEEGDMPELTIRLTSDVSDTHASMIAANEVLVPRMKELTDDKVTIEIYANSALGSVPENIESMRMGDLEMCWASDGAMAGAVDEWNLVGLPYMFTSTDAAYAAMDGDFGAELNKRFEESTGIINLGSGDVGFRNISNSKKTIVTPDDLKGIKIRTMTNTLHVEYFTALGAVPTPMSFSELFTALQQKTVDGQENPNALFYNNKLYEVQDYLTVSEHVWSCAPILVAKDYFESLPPEYQEALKTAVTETVEFQREMIQQQNRDYVTNIEEAGLEVTVLTPEQKDVFKKVAEDSVYKTAQEKYGQDLIDLAMKYND